MRKALKSKSARRQPKAIEYAPNFATRNYWLKIGLSENQIKLVKKLGQEYGFKKTPSAQCARMLVMLALANLPMIEETWRCVARYAEAEGLLIEKALDARAKETLAR